MQILGKRSKVLLMAVTIAMLVAIGISFAAWDSMSAVKATTGKTSTYANAKVGDIIEFGQYYQTGNRINNDANAEYEKTPIEWIVVDKDERTGQLTLMSRYILASGSYFGNYYNNKSGVWNAHYDNNASVADVPYNQAYVDSTARAFLNNLERLDVGGDSFDSITGYKPGTFNSTCDKTENNIFSKGSGLLANIGFSNKKYFTYLEANAAAASLPGFSPRADGANELYYQRPINNVEYRNRPATKGFLDEAFTDAEKSIILPKQIAGYTGFRWPDSNHYILDKSYIEGALDKVWLPSATELNVMNGKDWIEQPNDAWTNPSDESSSTVFEYFEDLKGDSLLTALQTKRTLFAKSLAGNFSIPLYKKGSSEINTDIHNVTNSSDHYWTRSPSSHWFTAVRIVNDLGLFNASNTHYSHIGVRPCVTVKF